MIACTITPRIAHALPMSLQPDEALSEVIPTSLEEALDLPRVALVFNGSGEEYFRIWAVNLTLTIFTLGLYGAWAKVRRLKYFYHNTLLDGSAFEYTANPASILLGRVLALALFALYYVAFDHSAHAGLGMTLLLVATLPYLLWQSNRFKARNTRFRGLEFGFEGSLGAAYSVYVPVIVALLGPTAAAYFFNPNDSMWLSFISVLLLLTLPFFHALFRKYVQSNLRFGDAQFAFSARSMDFVRTWAWAVAAMFVIGIVVGLFAFAFTVFGRGLLGTISSAPWFGVAAMSAVFWMVYLLQGSYFTARLQNLVWGKTMVGKLVLHCDVSATQFMYIQSMNTLWVILSLGLYRPYAAVRLAKYRLACLSVTGLESLDAVGAGPGQSRRGALGENTAELFDLDVGL